MHRIQTGLHLCNWGAAVAAHAQAPFFQVNCTRDLPMLGEAAVLRVPVDDDGGSAETNAALLALLPGAVAAIGEALRGGETVVVHCKAGQQRSPAVVAAYLMASRGLSAAAAIETVRALKPDAFFWSANFDAALRGFERVARENEGSITKVS